MHESGTSLRFKQYASAGGTVVEGTLAKGNAAERTRNSVNSAGWVRAAGVTRRTYQVSSNHIRNILQITSGTCPPCAPAGLVRAAVNCTRDQRTLSARNGRKIRRMVFIIRWKDRSRIARWSSDCYEPWRVLVHLLASFRGSCDFMWYARDERNFTLKWRIYFLIVCDFVWKRTVFLWHNVQLILHFKVSAVLNKCITICNQIPSRISTHAAPALMSIWGNALYTAGFPLYYQRKF